MFAILLYYNNINKIKISTHKFVSKTGALIHCFLTIIQLTTKRNNFISKVFMSRQFHISQLTMQSLKKISQILIQLSGEIIFRWRKFQLLRYKLTK